MKSVKYFNKFQRLVRNYFYTIQSQNSPLIPHSIADKKVEGISIIILSYNRKQSLFKLLDSLGSQHISNLGIEIIIINNFPNTILRKSRLSKLINQKEINLKVINSSYNWMVNVRYAFAQLSMYESILQIDDDIILKDNNFILDMYHCFKKLGNNTMLGCWNTLWKKQDSTYKSIPLTFTNTKGIDIPIKTDTCGMGICIYDKSIINRALIEFVKIDDMATSMFLYINSRISNFFFPSYGRLKFSEQRLKYSMDSLPGKKEQKIFRYYEMLDKGYIPVLEREPNYFSNLPGWIVDFINVL